MILLRGGRSRRGRRKRSRHGREGGGLKEREGPLLGCSRFFRSIIIASVFVCLLLPKLKRGMGERGEK